MNELTRRTGTGIAKFDPQSVKRDQAKIDAVIEFARKVQDWPLLEEAITAKIEDQREFVRWWDHYVTANKGGDRRSAIKVTDSVTLVLSAEQAEHHTGISKMQVSRWRKALSNVEKYREKLRLAARRKAELDAQANHRAEGTGENEWFTPAQYIEAARKVMGGIDLDPATHPKAQETIGAGAFFTRADDGLQKPWRGRVWLNPPYSQPEIWQFTEKLVAELSAGNVSEAILLTHNYTDTAWFHLAESIAALICFTRGRIKFIDIDGDECAPTQGQAFFYYGENGDAFRAYFSDFGFIR